MKKISLISTSLLLFFLCSSTLFGQQQTKENPSFIFQMGGGLSRTFTSNAALLPGFETKNYSNADFAFYYRAAESNLLNGIKFSMSELSSVVDPLTNAYGQAKMMNISYASGYVATFFKSRLLRLEAQGNVEIGYFYFHRSAKGLGKNPYAGHSTLHGMNITIGVDTNAWFGDLMMGIGLQLGSNTFFSRLNPGQPDKGTSIATFVPNIKFGVRF